jgi:predicted acyltransferase
LTPDKRYTFDTISANTQPSRTASLAYSLAFVFVCFLLAWSMYQRKIFLKV